MNTRGVRSFSVGSGANFFCYDIRTKSELLEMLATCFPPHTFPGNRPFLLEIHGKHKFLCFWSHYPPPIPLPTRTLSAQNLQGCFFYEIIDKVCIRSPVCVQDGALERIWLTSNGSGNSSVDWEQLGWRDWYTHKLAAAGDPRSYSLST